MFFSHPLFARCVFVSQSIALILANHPSKLILDPSENEQIKAEDSAAASAGELKEEEKGSFEISIVPSVLAG